MALEAAVFGEDDVPERFAKRVPAETRAQNLKDFQEWAKDYVLFLHVTSRVKSDKHQKLHSQRGGTGFPYLAVLDADGALLFGPASRNVEGFEFAMNKARAVQAAIADLEKKSTAGDADARKALYLKNVQLLRYSAAEAREALAELDLAEDEQKAFEAKVVDLDIREVMTTLTKDEETRIAAGATFAAMWEKGATPADPRKTEWRYFYHFVMVFAESEKDVGLFERALEVYREQLGSKRGSQTVITRFEKQLAELRGDSESE